ncbi:uncharacterized protein LOC117100454 [Anneissia japonica]|uniref:uncharacterized protein LOC117100454 n=1 Tax=Anneissia japonica TaxID=1529436 RepID=UPI001425509F|nr:uncharacterized protein LOC117100454 [Anneissia japonica]XP_033096057.1 uncharacterized protein LOC117100454 [Anneissia japonica]XP_033096063.1 uncharacterized protein LOC117100454 [Anneissia japonica]
MEFKYIIIIVLSTVIVTLIFYTFFNVCYRKFCRKELIVYKVPEDEEEPRVYYDPDENNSESSLPDSVAQQNSDINDLPGGSVKTQSNIFKKAGNSLNRRRMPSWHQVIRIIKTEPKAPANTNNFATFKPHNRKSIFRPIMQQNPLAEMKCREDDVQNTGDYISTGTSSITIHHRAQNIQQVSAQVHQVHTSDVADKKNQCGSPLDNEHQTTQVILVEENTGDTCEGQQDDEEIMQTPLENHSYDEPEYLEVDPNYPRLSNNLTKSVDLLHEKCALKVESNESLYDNFVLTSSYKKRKLFNLSSSMFNVNSKTNEDSLLCDTRLSIGSYCIENESEHHYRDYVIPNPHSHDICSYDDCQSEESEIYVPMNPVSPNQESVVAAESPYVNTKPVLCSSKSKEPQSGTYVGLSSLPHSPTMTHIQVCAEEFEEHSQMK